MFLQNPELVGLAGSLIKTDGINAEAALVSAVTQHFEALSALDVEYLRDRALPISAMLGGESFASCWECRTSWWKFRRWC